MSPFLSCSSSNLAISISCLFKTQRCRACPDYVVKGNGGKQHSCVRFMVPRLRLTGRDVSTFRRRKESDWDQWPPSIPDSPGRSPSPTSTKSASPKAVGQVLDRSPTGPGRVSSDPSIGKLGNKSVSAFTDTETVRLQVVERKEQNWRADRASTSDPLVEARLM